MGIKFLDVGPEVESKIIAFVNQEQMRQKKEGSRPFKAALMTLRSQEEIPTLFGLIKYKGMDLSHLQGKTSKAIIKELDVFSLKMESGLKLPLGMEVTLNFELAGEGPLQASGTVSSVQQTESGQVLLEVRLHRTPDIEKKLVWYVFRKYFKEDINN